MQLTSNSSFYIMYTYEQNYLKMRERGYLQKIPRQK